MSYHTFEITTEKNKTEATRSEQMYTRN